MSLFIPALAVALSAVPAENSQTLTLVDATRAAMEHNPELAEALFSVRAAEASVRSAGSLPEAMLSYQAWQQPWSKPFDPTATNMHMFGIRQSLPFPGQRGIAERAARSESAARKDDLRARRLAVQAQVTHAFSAWWRAREELRVHLDHMRLAERTLAAVEARYATGGGRQGDILRAQTDLHRLHADIAGIQESLRSSEGLLAAAMGRPADASLPPPAKPEVADSVRGAEVLLAAMMGGDPGQPASFAESSRSATGDVDRPEVAAALARVESAAATAQLADRARRAPDLMVGFDYMLMPGFPDAFSVMFQVGVPWFSSRRDAEAERAVAQAQQAREAASATASAARYERVEARARAQAAKAQLAVLEDDVVPRADRTLQALRASYSSGDADLVTLIDAENALIDAQLSAIRQHAALADATADLRRALGIDLIEKVKP